MRAEFRVPPRPASSSPSVYLCGNSLGLQPVRARAAVAAEMDKWAALGVEGHFTPPHPWLTASEGVAESLARLVGARPTEVTAMGSLSANLHALLTGFYRPSEGARRCRILLERGAFPSDAHVALSQVLLHGKAPHDTLLHVAPREGEDTIRTEVREGGVWGEEGRGRGPARFRLTSLHATFFVSRTSSRQYAKRGTLLPLCSCPVCSTTQGSSLILCVSGMGGCAPPQLRGLRSQLQALVRIHRCSRQLRWAVTPSKLFTSLHSLAACNHSCCAFCGRHCRVGPCARSWQRALAPPRLGRCVVCPPELPCWFVDCSGGRVHVSTTPHLQWTSLRGARTST